MNVTVIRNSSEIVTVDGIQYEIITTDTNGDITHEVWKLYKGKRSRRLTPWGKRYTALVGPQPVPDVPVANASEVIRAFFELLEASGLSSAAVARMAGYHPNLLTFWRAGKRSPSLVTIETMLQVIGYRLVIERDASYDTIPLKLANMAKRPNR